MLHRTYTNVWTLVEYLADYPIETYPLNQKGSLGGVTDLCSIDGRVTITMPHPECHLKAYSWKWEEWDEDGVWMRMFHNARAWLR